MPSAVPLPGYLPRVKSDGSGLEYVTVSELLLQVAAQAQPDATDPQHKVWIDTSAVPAAAHTTDPIAEAFAVTEAEVEKLGAKEARSESAAAVEAESDAFAHAGAAVENRTEAVGVTEAKADPFAMRAAGTESTTVTESSTDAPASGGGGGTSVSDNFNRTNGGLGVNYATISGLAAPAVAANQAAGTSGDSGAIWSANSFAANQYAECWNPSGGYVDTNPAAGVIVRGTSSARTFYWAGYEGYDDGAGGGYDHIALWKCVAGTWTRLGFWDCGTVGNIGYAGIVRLEAVGTSLAVKTAASHGGTYTTRISATDSAISSGSAGLYLQGSSGVLDNFYAGDL